MKTWCVRTMESTVAEGNFLQSRVVTRSGRALVEESEFLQEWASRMMQYYESAPTGEFLALDIPQTDRRTNTHRFYRRLFRTGAPTEDFVTVASETLGRWIEVELEGVVNAVQNRPHGNEPAYDVLSLVLDDQRRQALRLVQVKATEANLQGNCGIALNKFRKLEDGDHDPELMCDIRMHFDAGRLQLECSPADLLYRSRHYRITVLHMEDRDSIKILTTFEEKIPGARARRSARLVHIDDWRALWNALAEFVYARLTE